MGSSFTTLRGSHRVSPVFTLSIFPTAPMSPQESFFTSSVFLPRMAYSLPSFSVRPVRALTMGISDSMVPESTLT